MHQPPKPCRSCSKEPTERVNIPRFIQKLDEQLAREDLDGAVKTVEYWEKEARQLGDVGGLLCILNEQLGLYRRLGDREKALGAVEAALPLLEGENAPKNSLSRATIYINLATTLKACGQPERALPYYARAARIYIDNGQESTYEYAALLNNRSAALCDLGEYDQAEKDLHTAIAILKEEGRHDGDVALSYVGLAHLTYDRDETAHRAVEELLDTAWEYINSPRQVRDGNYAFAIRKCAPAFRYFGRDLEADALEQVAEEIYGGAG